MELGIDLNEVLLPLIQDGMHLSLDSVIILFLINLGALGEHLQGYLSSNKERIEKIIAQDQIILAPKFTLHKKACMPLLLVHF